MLHFIGTSSSPDLSKMLSCVFQHPASHSVGLFGSAWQWGLCRHQFVHDTNPGVLQDRVKALHFYPVTTGFLVWRHRNINIYKKKHLTDEDIPISHSNKMCFSYSSLMMRPLVCFCLALTTLHCCRCSLARSISAALPKYQSMNKLLWRKPP